MLPVHVKEAPFTVKKNLPGVGVGNGGGKATAVMPHGGGKVTGQWTIPPPRPRWGGGGGGGLSLIGALGG